MKFKWEKLAEYTRRAKVYGGWLVHVWTPVDNDSLGDVVSEAMVFIPDPKHEWVIDDQ